MTTLTQPTTRHTTFQPSFKTPLKTSLRASSPSTFIDHSADFVSTDMAALASHMDHCASKRSRFFNVHAALEMVHSVVFSRIVTAALLAGVVVALVGLV